jgi:hypothetical protein
MSWRVLRTRLKMRLCKLLLSTLLFEREKLTE